MFNLVCNIAANVIVLGTFGAGGISIVLLIMNLVTKEFTNSFYLSLVLLVVVVALYILSRIGTLGDDEDGEEESDVE